MRSTVFIPIFFSAAPYAFAQSVTVGADTPTAPAESTPPASSAPVAAASIKEPYHFKVLQKGKGRPLSKVEVNINGVIYYTEADGSVTVEKPQPKQKISVTKAGFERRIFEASELFEQSSDPKFYLEPGEPDDSNIMVIGQRRPEASKKTISVQETTRVAPQGDPAQITKLLPGVQSGPFNGEVVIRGSGPNDSRYFIDDIQVPYIFHRIGSISVIPDQLLSDVDFSSGGFGPQYGDATGGVIVLKTTSEVPEYPKTEFRVNIPFFSSLYHERPLSKDSSLALSVRRSYLEAILPAVIPKDSGFTLVPYFADGHIRYLKNSDDGSLKVTTIYASDGLKLTGPEGGFGSSGDEKSKIDYLDQFVTLGVEKKWFLNNGWTLRTTPQLAYTSTEVTLPTDYFKLRLTRFRAPTELSKRLSKNETFYVGLDPVVASGKIDVLAPVPVDDDPYYDFEDAPKFNTNNHVYASSYAAWTAMDFAIGSFILTPGIRAFSHSTIKKPGVDPRFSMRYKLNEDHELKASVGQYSIAPEEVESSEEFGNPDIGYEISNHYIFGIESKWGPRWSTDFQAFFKRTYKLIGSDPIKRYKNEGTRLTQGFEAFIRRNLTERFFAWLSYTYSVSKERKDEDHDYKLSSYDQTHIANIAASYRLNAAWEVGTRIKYNTGSPYSPVKHAVYNATLDKYQPIISESDENSERLPEYQAIDLFATRDALYDNWKLSYRFGINYLAAKRPVLNIDYNYDYTERKDFQGLPPIPYFELRGEL